MYHPFESYLDGVVMDGGKGYQRALFFSLSEWNKVVLIRVTICEYRCFGIFIIVIVEMVGTWDVVAVDEMNWM